MWTPNDGSLTDNNINNPVATPTEKTIYTVYGIDSAGCRDTASITIDVDYNDHEFIPTGFTPNGDGRNDVFGPMGLKYQKLIEFMVFNRWGQMVFSANSDRQMWDGTFNGQPLDAGVYFYTITVNRANGEKVSYKGDVTLIR
jgi:gliding motility-associated-like protein